MISLKTRRHRVCCIQCCLSCRERLTMCSLAARWGLCTFILMDALRFSSSLLWDTGGHAERLDSSLAAGGVSPASSRTFQSTRCLPRFLVRTGGRKPLWNTGGGLYFQSTWRRWKTNDDLWPCSSDCLLRRKEDGPEGINLMSAVWLEQNCIWTTQSAVVVT